MRKLYRSSRNMVITVNNKLAELCGILLFIIMILLTVNLVSRELGFAIPGLTNLAVLILLAVVYLGLGRCEWNDEHAAVDMIPNVLPPKPKRYNSLLVNILKFIAIAIFFYASIESVISSFQTKESFADVISIPIWPAKLAIVIGLLFFALEVLFKIFEDINRIITGKDIVKVNNDHNNSQHLF